MDSGNNANPNTVIKEISLVKTSIEDTEKEIEELQKRIPPQQKPTEQLGNDGNSSSQETLSSNISALTNATEQKSVSDQKKSSKFIEDGANEVITKIKSGLEQAKQLCGLGTFNNGAMITSQLLVQSNYTMVLVMSAGIQMLRLVTETNFRYDPQVLNPAKDLIKTYELSKKYDSLVTDIQAIVKVLQTGNAPAGNFDIQLAGIVSRVLTIKDVQAKILENIGDARKTLEATKVEVTAKYYGIGPSFIVGVGACMLTAIGLAKDSIPSGLIYCSCIILLVGFVMFVSTYLTFLDQEKKIAADILTLKKLSNELTAIDLNLNCEVRRLDFAVKLHSRAQADSSYRSQQPTPDAPSHIKPEQI